MSSALLPALIGSQGGGGGGGGGDVTSVFGRQGVVAAQADDYTAGQITNVPAGTVAATNVQAAITELDGEKASKATTVTAGAGLTGGGDLSANRTLSVGGGAGITVNADDVAMSDMAQATLKGRASGAGTGAPQDLTAAQARTLLNVADGATAAGATGDAYAASHEADATAHAAANITCVPTGDIAATNVQTALTEIASEKVPGARLIATQHSLTGGGDLTANRTLSLVNDAAAPGVGRYYGTDASGAKGWFAMGGSGTLTFGDSGVLSFSKTATGLESVVTGGISVDADTWDADATKVTFQYEGSILNNSGSNKTASFQIKLGTTIINIDGATTKTTAGAIGSRSTARGTSVTLELWRLTSTTMGGAITVDIDGVALTQGVLATATGLDFGAPIIVDLLVNFSATPVTIAFSLWEWSRVGTTAGTGAQQRTATTMAALRAIDPAASPALANGELCYLQGFTTPGDGGEGYFMWSSTTAATEDYGTVIVPDTAPANGRWLRQVGGQPYRFEWFGARGDGATADDVAVQRCLNAVGVIKGTAYVTDGKVFKTVGEITIPDDVSIVSNGHGVLDVVSTWYTPGYRVEFRGVRFRATGRVNGQCIYKGLTATTRANLDLVVDRCYFETMQCSAAAFDFVDRCQFTNNVYIGDPAVTSAWGYYALVLYSGRDWTITNNYMRNALQMVRITGGQRNRVTNNHFEDCRVGIFFQSSGQYATDAAEHVAAGLNLRNVVANNLIRGFREEAISFDSIMDSVQNAGQNKTIASDTVYSITDPDSTLNNRLQVNFATIDADAVTGWANGYYIGFLSGRLEGYCAPIIASGKDGSNRPYVQIAKVGGGIIDGAGTYLATGDRFWVFVGHIENTITGNVVEQNNKGTSSADYSTCLSLWGGCWLNVATGNVFSTAYRGAVVDGYYGPADNTEALGPSASNRIANNIFNRVWDSAGNTQDDGTPLEGHFDAYAGREFALIRIGTGGDSNLSAESSATSVWPRVLNTDVSGNTFNFTGGLAIADQWGRGTVIDNNRFVGDPKGAIYLAHSMNPLIGRNFGANGRVIGEAELSLLHTLTPPSYRWLVDEERVRPGPRLNREYFFETDFAETFAVVDDGTKTTPAGWGIAVANAKARVENKVPEEQGRIGVVQIANNAAATGGAAIYRENKALRLDTDNSTTLFEADVRVNALSAAGQVFTLHVGLANNSTAAAPSIGLWVSYTHGTNGGKWLFNAGNGSSATIDTGVAVAANTWYHVVITQSSAAGKAKCSINGSAWVEIATNIPSGYAQSLDVFLALLKTSGTNDIEFRADTAVAWQEIAYGRAANAVPIRPRTLWS